VDLLPYLPCAEMPEGDPLPPPASVNLSGCEVLPGPSVGLPRFPLYVGKHFPPFPPFGLAEGSPDQVPFLELRRALDPASSSLHYRATKFFFFTAYPKLAPSAVGFKIRD